MDRRPPIPVNTGYEPVAQNESRDVPHRQIHTPGHGAMHNWVPRNHFAMVFQQPICIYQANTSMLPLFYSPNSVAGPRFPAPTAYYGNIFPCYPSMANSNQSMHQQTSERVAVFNHYMPEEAPPYQQAMHQQFQMSENVDTRSWQDQTRHVSQNTFGPLNNVARMQKTAIDFSPDEEHGNHPGSVVEDIIGSISQPEVQATSMTYPAMNCEIQKTAIGAERRSNLIRGTHLAYLRQNQRVCYKFQNNGLLTYPTFEGTRISEPLPAVLEEQSDEPYTLRTALGAMNLEQKEGPTLKSWHTPVCTFCVMTKRHVDVCTSHTLTDETGKLTCPFQVNHTCPLCNTLGHTSHYCPQSARQQTPQVGNSDDN